MVIDIKITSLYVSTTDYGNPYFDPYACKAFRHVETLFIQGNVFPPTNSRPGRMKTLLWMNKISTCVWDLSH